MISKLVLFTGALVCLSPAFASDAEAGKAKSAVCSACHGQGGISTNPMWPNIAGQQSGYLKKQLTEFRDGIRKDPLMTPIAASLTNEDIDNLSAYFASL